MREFYEFALSIPPPISALHLLIPSSVLSYARILFPLFSSIV